MGLRPPIYNQLIADISSFSNGRYLIFYQLHFLPRHGKSPVLTRSNKMFLTRHSICRPAYLARFEQFVRLSYLKRMH